MIGVVPLLLLFRRHWGAEPDDLRAALAPGWELTEDRSRLTDADLVVFHLPETDVLEFARLPKRAGQLWAGWSVEADAHHPQQAADLVVRRLDLRMTHRLSADVPIPYLLGFTDELVEHTPAANGAAPGTVAAFISSGADRSGRVAYLQELMRHLPVDSYGSTLRNTGPHPEDDRTTAGKLRVLRHYRYTVAFENAVEDGYVTEKLYDALAAGCVPLYLGAPVPEVLLPHPRCLLDATRFTPAGLAAEIRRLDADPEAFAGLHEWRHRGANPAFVALERSLREHPVTRLCRLAEQRLGG